MPAPHFDRACSEHDSRFAYKGNVFHVDLDERPIGLTDGPAGASFDEPDRRLRAAQGQASFRSVLFRRHARAAFTALSLSYAFKVGVRLQ